MANGNASKSVSFGGSQITSVQNLNYTHTPTSQLALRGDDELFPTKVAVRGMVPTLTFQTLDLQHAATLYNGATGAVEWVEDILSTGTGSSGTITCTAATGVVWDVTESADLNGVSALDVTIVLESADGTDPVTRVIA